MQLDDHGNFLMIKCIFTLPESMRLCCFCLSVSPDDFNFNYFIKRLGFAYTEARGSFTIDNSRVRGSPLIRVHNKSETYTHMHVHMCIHIYLYTPRNIYPIRKLNKHACTYIW